MNVKVIERFKDRETGEIRKVGEVFDASEERCAEILKVGKFIEVCQPEEVKTEPVAEEVAEKPKKTKAKAKK